MRLLVCSLPKSATQPIIAVSCIMQPYIALAYCHFKEGRELFLSTAFSCGKLPHQLGQRSFGWSCRLNMWKHNPSKFITNDAEARSLTHFLAIPLLSPVSRPAFRNSITRLLDDPSAASVPRHDIRPLDTLHLRVGTMNLTDRNALRNRLRFFEV